MLRLQFASRAINHSTYPSGERFGGQGKRRIRGCWWSGGWDFLDDHCMKVTVGCRAGCVTAVLFRGVGTGGDAWSGWGLLFFVSTFRAWGEGGRMKAEPRPLTVVCRCFLMTLVVWERGERQRIRPPFQGFGLLVFASPQGVALGCDRARLWRFTGNRTRSVRTSLLASSRLPVGIFCRWVGEDAQPGRLCYRRGEQPGRLCYGDASCGATGQLF